MELDASKYTVTHVATEKIKEIIRQRMNEPAETIELDDNLRRHDGLFEGDMLEFVDTILACEVEFGISIPERLEACIDTVEDLIAIVDKALDKKHRGRKNAGASDDTDGG